MTALHRNALVTLLLAVSQTALAGTYDPDNVTPGDSISGVYTINIAQQGTPPTVTVSNDGNQYDGIEAGAAANFSIHYYGKCRTLRRVRELDVWVNDNSKVAPISYHDHHVKVWKLDVISSKTKSDHASGTVPIGGAVPAPLAAAAKKACNAYLDQQLNAGKTRTQVFSEPHLLSSDDVTPALSGVVYLRCSSKSGLNTKHSHAWQHLRVNYLCAGPKPQTPRPAPGASGKLNVPFAITKAGVAAQPARQTAPCPATVKFNATITANKGGENVKYRWWHNGALGPVHTARLNTSGWAAVTTQIKAGGAVPKAGGSGFLAPPPGGTPASQLKASAADAQGWMALKVLREGEADWNRARQSNKAGYAVTCQARPGLSVAVPGTKRAPDILSRGGLRLGSKYGPWGSVLNVTGADASRAERGRCEFRMKYPVLNGGNAATAPAFASRLKEGGTVLHTRQGMVLNAGAATKVSGSIWLNEGSHLLYASLDDGKQVGESKEGNNLYRIRVNVASCGGSAEPARETGAPARSLR